MRSGCDVMGKNRVRGSQAIMNDGKQRPLLATCTCGAMSALVKKLMDTGVPQVYVNVCDEHCCAGILLASQFSAADGHACMQAGSRMWGQPSQSPI